VTDVVGLYLNPLQNAMVLWVDEKSQIKLWISSSSWLNLVQRWFGELTSKRIRQRTFRGVADSVQATEEWRFALLLRNLPAGTCLSPYRFAGANITNHESTFAIRPASFLPA
jgi:hypothetical protein